MVNNEAEGRSILAAVYVGVVGLFTICVVAVVEAMAQVDRTGRQIKGRGRVRS